MSVLTIVGAVGDLVAIACFIQGLILLNAPSTARAGNRLAMAGMAIAMIFAAWQTLGAAAVPIVVGILVGGAIGVVAAMRVKMTAMPQMVALYNGAGAPFA